MIKNVFYALLGYTGDGISKTTYDNQTLFSLTPASKEHYTRSEVTVIQQLLDLGVQYQALMKFSQSIRAEYSTGLSGSSILCSFGCAINTVILEPYATVC